MNGQARGRDTEERACAYLESRGLRLVARNHCCLFVEIDSNIQGDSILVFVEMRLRRRTGVGGTLTSVDQFKRSRLIASAQHYLQARVYFSDALRGDGAQQERRH